MLEVVSLVVVGIKLASPATGTPILYTYTGLKLETINAYSSPGNKIVTSFNFKIEV